jgi:hypothetical protein
LISPSGLTRDRVHLRAHGRVGGAQRGEPHLRCRLAQRAGEGLQLHFFGEGGMARIVQRGRRAFHRFTVRARAARQVDVQVQAQLLGHLVGEAVGGLGVVAVVHPDHGHVLSGARDHVQDHGLERTEVGRDDRGLAQADGPVHQAFGVAAQLGVDRALCEVDVGGDAHVGYGPSRRGMPKVQKKAAQ